MGKNLPFRKKYLKKTQISLDFIPQLRYNEIKLRGGAIPLKEKGEKIMFSIYCDYSKRFFSLKKANEFMEHIERCGVTDLHLDFNKDAFGQNVYTVMWNEDEE